MKSTTFTTHLYDEEVEVEYHCTPAYSGTYYQPPEPEDVELVSVLYKGVNVLPLLCDSDYCLMVERALENEQSYYTDYMEYQAECAIEEERMQNGWGYK